jgi:hypothetical protein
MKRSRLNPVSKTRRSRSGVPGKLGIVRLYGVDLAVLRLECYLRDGGCCQWEEDGKKCGKLLPLDGDVLTRAHMAHIKNKRMYGDILENVRILCYQHHMIAEHNPKSVPAK